MAGRAAERRQMVARQIAARGVRNPRVLRAMERVPREAFVPPHLEEFAYADNALPIEQGQTISQPYVVGLMIDALDLPDGARVLDVGTGSGYAAAVCAHIADRVYSIERFDELAREARERLARLGYDNVEVKTGDGSKGWAEHAPFDGIVVAAAAPSVPRSLLEQLAVGARLIIPVEADDRLQSLVRITRTGADEYETEDLGPVRFVPLVGEEGWTQGWSPRRPTERIPDLIGRAAEPFDAIDDVDLVGLLDRIGDARVVLLGESTHGTSEFYRMRARITQELVMRAGFRAIALEADWPDAARIDRYVRHEPRSDDGWVAFSRFPTWMWRNREVVELVEWLRAYNAELDPPDRVSVHGLDLYSMYTSIDEVLRYLDEQVPEAAELARERYGCLTRYQRDPETYGRMAVTHPMRTCEPQVVAMLEDLLAQRSALASRDESRFLDAVQNAQLVVNAEQYYRTMYYGSAAAWNLRDRHMFETLRALLSFRGPRARIAVWEHNSHIGDASATEMAARGEHNVGSLCRRELGEPVYLIGFGTHGGTVAAARRWGGPMEVMRVRDSHEQSYERLCHEAPHARFLLPLRGQGPLERALSHPRLERAIGVVYRPDTELASHYFEAVLPRQFDEYVWFDRSVAVTPLPVGQVAASPDTYPFGL